MKRGSEISSSTSIRFLKAHKLTSIFYGPFKLLKNLGRPREDSDIFSYRNSPPSLARSTPRAMGQWTDRIAALAFKRVSQGVVCSPSCGRWNTSPDFANLSTTGFHSNDFSPGESGATVYLTRFQYQKIKSRYSLLPLVTESVISGSH